MCHFISLFPSFTSGLVVNPFGIRIRFPSCGDAALDSHPPGQKPSRSDRLTPATLGLKNRRASPTAAAACSCCDTRSIFFFLVRLLFGAVAVVLSSNFVFLILEFIPACSFSVSGSVSGPASGPATARGEGFGVGCSLLSYLFLNCSNPFFNLNSGQHVTKFPPLRKQRARSPRFLLLCVCPTA